MSRRSPLSSAMVIHFSNRLRNHSMLFLIGESGRLASRQTRFQIHFTSMRKPRVRSGMALRMKASMSLSSSSSSLVIFQSSRPRKTVTVMSAARAVRAMRIRFSMVFMVCLRRGWGSGLLIQGILDDKKLIVKLGNNFKGSVWITKQPFVRVAYVPRICCLSSLRVPSFCL